MAIRFFSSGAWFALFGFVLVGPCWSDDLESVLKRLSASSGVNYIVASDVALEQAMPPIESVDELLNWLDSQGLRVEVLENGDLLITRAVSRRVDLSSLQVDAPPWPIQASDEVLERAASNTRIDSDVMDDLGDTNLDDLFLRSGNVFGNASEFYVRGVPSQGDLNTLGNASALSGDVPIPTGVLSALPVSTWDLQSAEFQRGARSSDTAGPFSTFAGGIRLNPKVPSYEKELLARLRYDDLGDDQVALAINYPWIEEELAVRFSIDRESSDGSLTGSSVNFDAYQSLTGRFSMIWEPAALPGWQGELQTWAVKGDSGPQRVGLNRNQTPFRRQGRAAPYRRQAISASTASAKLQHESEAGNMWELEIATSEGRDKIDPTRSLPNTFDPAYSLVNQTSSQLSFGNLVWRRQLGPGTLEAGLSRGTTQLRETLSRDQRSWNLRSKLNRETATIGYEAPLSDRWSAQGKVRYSADRLQKNCRSSGLSGNESAVDCFDAVGLLLIPLDGSFAAFDENYSQWSPELGLSYQQSQDSEWLVHVYQGFNAGGAFSSADFSGEPYWIFYQPEESQNMELGWRGRLTDGFAARATAFYTSLSKQWTAIEGGISLRDVVNTGRSRSSGIELDGDWRWNESHRLGFSFGWLETRFVDFTPFERDARIETAAGNVFPGAPDYSGSVYYVGEFGRWRVSAATSFHGDVYANANNTQEGKIDSVALLDLQLTFRIRHGSISAYVRNALNSNYHETTPNVSRSVNRIDFLPGDPRTVGLILELIL